MAAISFSLLRHHATLRFIPSPTTYLLLHRNFSHLTATIFSRKFQDKEKHDQSQALRAAREREYTRDKHTHSSSTLLKPGFLSPNQAIGMVASAQANFMRVNVIVPPEHSIALKNEGLKIPEGSESGIGVELLCVVRAVLKKIKRRVLVGDKVLVGSIDWVDRRGMIEDVYPRKSEILEPPIANADHFMVVFSMDQPKVEPFLLTRFLVEAESTGFPVTLALNKCELVSDEVRNFSVLY